MPPMIPDTPVDVEDVVVWVDSGGGVTIHAATPEGAPIELSLQGARRLAQVLLDAADLDERT
jgi:hypothetical protein